MTDSEYLGGVKHDHQFAWMRGDYWCIYCFLTPDETKLEEKKAMPTVDVDSPCPTCKKMNCMGAPRFKGICPETTAAPSDPTKPRASMPRYCNEHGVQECPRCWAAAVTEQKPGVQAAKDYMDQFEKTHTEKEPELYAIKLTVTSPEGIAFTLETKVPSPAQAAGMFRMAIENADATLHTLRQKKANGG